MLADYILQNWALILISVAFVISMKITGFRDPRTAKRMYLLIAGVFLLSIVVFTEFHLADLDGYIPERTVLMAVRYSATPLIVAMGMYTLQKKVRWVIFIPALVLTVIDVISIFTGIVFRLDESGALQRGVLGYLPFIVAALYGVCLVWTLYRQSNKLYTEIVPIAFLGVAFASGVVMPFLFGSLFARIFCTTIVIALYVYYVFSILQLTKKDPMTDVLNLQAFYADSETGPEDITAVVSMDMNGLKAINDTYGHSAGDAALIALVQCFRDAVIRREALYRIGGDEFAIICRHHSEEDVQELVKRIRQKTAETEYSCSIGYSLKGSTSGSVPEMLKEADRIMYEDKKEYYISSGKDRRRR